MRRYGKNTEAKGDLTLEAINRRVLSPDDLSTVKIRVHLLAPIFMAMLECLNFHNIPLKIFLFIVSIYRSSKSRFINSVMSLGMLKGEREQGELLK